MEKTKIGLIGCGVISKIYLENIRKFFQQMEVIACADMNREKAEQTAKEFGIVEVCEVTDILEHPKVEIILNLTIPQVHYELNKKAILNGKHAYCEKPLALSMKEARELVDLADEKRVKIGCAPDSFLGSALQTCRKLIDEGEIGTPVGATANMMNHGVETWHPSPDFFYQSGGGPMWDMGPYYITAFVSLLGAIKETGNFSGKGFTQRKIYSKPRRGEVIPVDISTYYAGILKFENGVIANINMSFDVWLSNLPKMEIYGTDGTLVIPDPNHFGGSIRLIRGEALIDEIEGLENHQAVGRLSRPQMWEKSREIPHVFQQPHDNMRGIGLADMADAIRHNRNSRVDARLACHVTEVLESLSENGVIKQLQTRCERPEPFRLTTR